jgi:hypothetical protein
MKNKSISMMKTRIIILFFFLLCISVRVFSQCNQTPMSSGVYVYAYSCKNGEAVFYGGSGDASFNPANISIYRADGPGWYIKLGTMAGGKFTFNEYHRPGNGWGQTYFYYQVKLGANCYSLYELVEVDDKDVYEPIISGNNFICRSGTVTLTVTGPHAGFGGYKWIAPNGTVESTTGQLSKYVSGNLITYYDVVNFIDDYGCQSESTRVYIVVRSPPPLTAPIPAATDLCGPNAYIAVDDLENADSYRWWYEDGGGLHALPDETEQGINVTVPFGKRRYYVAGYNALCNEEGPKTAITVGPPSVNIYGHSCKDGVAIFTAATDPGVNLNAISIYLEGNIIGTMAGGTFTYNEYHRPVNGWGQSHFYFRYNGTCGSSTLYPIEIDDKYIPKPVITGNTELCRSGTITLTASGGWGDAYVWRNSSGGIESSTNQLTKFFAGSTDVYYTVTNFAPDDYGCEGDIETVGVHVRNPAPLPAPTPLNSVVCQYTATIGVHPLAGASSYKWWYEDENGLHALPNTSATMPVAVTYRRRYYVAGYNALCNEEGVRAAIDVGIPFIAVYAHSCTDGTAIFTSSTGPGINPSTISIHSDDNLIGTMAGGTFTYNEYHRPGNGWGQSHFYFRNNGICGSSALNAIDIDDKYIPKPVITGNTELCRSGTINLTASGNGFGSTYVWRNSSGGIESRTNQLNKYFASSADVYYNVTSFAPDDYGCEGDIETVGVHVRNPAPLPAPTPLNSAVCQYTATIGVHPLAGANSYRWWYEDDNGLHVLHALPDTGETISASSTSYSKRFYYVAGYNALCNEEGSKATIVVGFPFVAVNAHSCKDGEAVFISTTEPGINPSTISIHVGDVMIGTMAGGKLIYNEYHRPGGSFEQADYYFRYNGGCSPATYLPIDIDDKIVNKPTVTPINKSFCRNGEPVKLFAAGYPEGRYRWYDSKGGLVGISSLFIIPANLQTSTDYYLSGIEEDYGCESDQTLVHIPVYDPPPPFTSGPLVPSSIATEDGIVKFSCLRDDFPYYRLYDVDNNEIGGGSSCDFIASVTHDTELYVTIYDRWCRIESPKSKIDVFVGSNRNFIKTYAIQKQDIFTEADVSRATKQSTVEYFDGMGRPSQKVLVRNGPFGDDIVHAISYDAVGRESVHYLPFVSGPGGKYNEDFLPRESPFYPISVQGGFYQNTTLKVALDTRPYAETVYEASPLNRILKQSPVGEAWKPNSDPLSMDDKTIKKKYEMNGDKEVLLFSYDLSTGLITLEEDVEKRHYLPLQLFANKTYDEYSNETIEYSDKEGKTVCKKIQYKTVDGVSQYASTYYIYDDVGNLVVVLPPEAVKEFLLAIN